MWAISDSYGRGARTSTWCSWSSEVLRRQRTGRNSTMVDSSVRQSRRTATLSSSRAWNSSRPRSQMSCEVLFLRMVAHTHISHNSHSNLTDKHMNLEGSHICRYNTKPPMSVDAAMPWNAEGWVSSPILVDDASQGKTTVQLTQRGNIIYPIIS